jgi:hypothetical protein
MTERRELRGSTRELISAAFCNVGLFGMWVGAATLSPEAEPICTEAFGPRPFGFPVMKVVFVAFAVAYLPLTPAICALMRIAMIRRDQGDAERRADWQRVDALAVELRAALRIALWGLAYFLTISLTWAVYADANGLPRK